MGNTALARTTMALLTNKSGSGVNQGDAVVIDTTTAASFTTTTTVGYVNGEPGIVLEPNGIANNASGMVAFGGWVPKVNLSGAASLGDLFKTHSAAGQCVRHAAPIVAGDFGIVLGTGTSPAALLFGTGIQGAGTLSDGTWTDYTATSTVVGWSSFTTKKIYYKQVGKTVFVTYEFAGASNSTTTTFTLPAAAVATPASIVWMNSAQDNGGSFVASVGAVAGGASLATLYKSAAYEAYSNTGTKSAYGQFWYVTA